MVDKTEFVFPDESQENKQTKELKSDTPEIEIVDDTPEADKNRKPLDREVFDPSDDELNEYSDKVKQRIKELTHARHDERRKREQMEREHQEALRLAQAALQENNSLKKRLEEGTTAHVSQTKELAQIRLNNAKAKVAAAHEAGDTQAFVEAQQEMAAAILALERANEFKPQPLQAQPNPANVAPNAPQHPPAATLDPRAVQWKERNPWFGSDDEMTAFVLGVHRRLVTTGVDPSSDAYYNAIDKRVREVFPDRFKDSTSKIESSTTSKPATVVAPASRSAAPKKVVLTATQVSIAKRLGVPLEIYAKKVAELEQRNG